MFHPLPLRSSSPPGSTSQAVATDQPIRVPRPEAIRDLFDTLPLTPWRDMEQAMDDYLRCGPAPNYDAMYALLRASHYLKSELIESDKFDGTDIASPLFAHAEQILTINNDSPEAPQLLLSHLERTIDQYRRCDDNLRQDLTPQLHVALTRYCDLLNDRDMRAPDDDHIDLGQRHEQTRSILVEPQRQRIIRDFARRAAQTDGPMFDVFAHLGITSGYRATDQDRSDFRALFESGRIVRRRMVYTSPEECRRLYLQYMQEVTKAMRDDGISGDLHDMIAVRTYTISSNELNLALREADLDVINRFAPYIKTFVSGLARLHGPRRSMPHDADGFVTLKRALQMSEDEIFRAGYVPGVIFRQPTPMSCSDNPNVSYLILRNKYNVHIDVRCKLPRRVGEISRHAHSEGEWVVPLQAWFEVKASRWRHGGTDSHPRLDLVFEQVDEPAPRPDSPSR